MTVPAGQFTATRIAIHISERGSELQDTRFWLWLAHDAARTPVLIEAEVPFGTARIDSCRCHGTEGCGRYRADGMLSSQLRR